MDDRRKLPPIGSTKTVDGVIYTAVPYTMDGKALDGHVLWDGGARGGSIREGAAKTLTGTGWNNDSRVVTLPRFSWSNQGRDTFAPIARLSIAAQRSAYQKAKALVDAYEEQA